MGQPISKMETELPEDEGWYKFPEEDELRAHFQKTIPQEHMWNDKIVDKVISECKGSTVQGWAVADIVMSNFLFLVEMRNINAECACKIVEDAIAPFLIKDE